MAEIRRVGRDTIRFRRLSKDKAESFALPQENFSLPFRRSPQETYTFESGRVLLNGMDVLSLVEGKETDIELLVNITGAVDEYRREVWSRFTTKRRDFNALTQAILEKAMTKLGIAYESMAGGVRVNLSGGRLWINDIDPKVVLTLFLSHPTEERKRYLKSIQMKLALILEGKIGNAHSHGVLEEARGIFVQIEKALENQAASSLPPLLADSYPLDR